MVGRANFFFLPPLALSSIPSRTSSCQYRPLSSLCVFCQRAYSSSSEGFRVIRKFLLPFTLYASYTAAGFQELNFSIFCIALPLLP